MAEAYLAFNNIGLPFHEFYILGRVSRVLKDTLNTPIDHACVCVFEDSYFASNVSENLASVSGPADLRQGYGSGRSHFPARIVSGRIDAHWALCKHLGDRL